MTLAWLPAARRHPINGQPGFAWQVDCPPKILWHTTEGGNNVPSYTPGLKAPHATVIAKSGVGVDVHQHIPLDRAAYSLVHAAGTPPTNGAHVFQFELAGTSERGGPGYYWPGADDAVLRDLYVKVAKPIHDAYGVRLTAPTFKAYPASYGDTNGVRLSGQAFLAHPGHVGHQHAPGNVHGDPGAFPWARFVQLATGDDDMTTDESVRAIVKAEIANALKNKANLGNLAEVVWATHGASPTPTAWDRLKAAANPPAPPTAEAIAAAITAHLQALPAGTATVSADAIAEIAKVVWDEGATRLVR